MPGKYALVALSCVFSLGLLCVQTCEGRHLKTSSASASSSCSGGPSSATASGSARSSGGTAGSPGTVEVISGSTTPSCTRVTVVGTSLQAGNVSTAAEGIAAARNQDSATDVLQSIGQSFKAVGSSPAAGANFAQNLAMALAEATNSNIESAALCLGMAATVGGSSETALARAIATALAGGNTAVALPIKEAMLVTVASYGCSSFRPTLLEAQTAAGGGGSGEAFKSSLAKFSGLSDCLTGVESTATSAAKAQAALMNKRGKKMRKVTVIEN